MHLEGHHEDGGWLLSTFTLTNRVSWEMMLQAVYAAFEYFADITIFVDDQSVELESRADVLSIPEARSIGIAGESVVVKEPMIIIFYNQVHFINLRIRCGNDDLRDLDYEGFNKIVCPIVDAIELAMYQEPVPTPVKDDATEETEDAEEEKRAEASAAEPPIPPPPATEPQDSVTPADAPAPGAEPPIPLPPAEATAPPNPTPPPSPRKTRELPCNKRKHRPTTSPPPSIRHTFFPRVDPAQATYCPTRRRASESATGAELT